MATAVTGRQTDLQTFSSTNIQFKDYYGLGLVPESLIIY